MEKIAKKGFVQIPEPTLKALKRLLFNKDGDIDLSPIIDDIAFPGNEDITAINVGLTYKGLTPQIDDRPRIFSDEVHEFIGFSLIMGIVKAQNKEGKVCGIPYESWMEAKIVEQ